MAGIDDFVIENGMLKYYKGNEENVVIPEGVTSISNSAFDGRPEIKSITIPISVKQIDDAFYYYCENIEKITVFDDNKVYDSRNNCNAIIETETNTLLKGCKNTIIPDDVSIIGFGAFENCERLTEIIIPPSVKSIREEAFRNCTELKKVIIPDGVTEIGYQAFCGCTDLENITIPDSVTYIGDWAFSECDNLTIHASAGSCAENFTKENNIPFVAEG